MERTRPVVGVLGGGQLGRMLALAGLPLGLEFRFLDPSPTAPAGLVGDLRIGPLDDPEAARVVAAGASVVTYEWEGVAAAAARAAETLAALRRGAAALETAQDRGREKATFERLGIAVPRSATVDDRAGLDRAVATVGLPAVLKTRRGGYDGKGQRLLRGGGDAAGAWAELGDGPPILEELVAFPPALSVPAGRPLDRTTPSH